MATPVETVLSRLKGSYSPSGDGWLCSCPAHEDTKPSLKVSTGNDGRAILYCHTGCQLADILTALSLTLADIAPQGESPLSPKPAKPPVRDWKKLAIRFAEAFTAKPREVLAESLGLPSMVFDSLPNIGARSGKGDADGSRWTFPETDGDGNVIGICVRFFKDGQKRQMKGGNRGLILPLGWKERSGTIYVVEGASDTLAMTAAGLSAIGRPSSLAAGVVMPHLVRALRSVPADKPIVVFGENDQKSDGKWPGLTGANRTAARLAEELGRPIEVAFPPGSTKDVRAWLVDAVKGGRTWADAGVELERQIRPCAGRIRLLVTTDEYNVNEQVCAAVSADPDLFVRVGRLVRVVQQNAIQKHECSFPPGPRIGTASIATLREHISRRVEFYKLRVTRAATEEVPVHPPDWCVGAVRDRGNWPAMRNLESVVDYPVIRPDGSIISQPGYDAATDIYYHPVGRPPEFPSEFTLETATRAYEQLEEAVVDFPFLGDMYKSAWLAAVLTPLARFAFRGPAPLFLVDGNVRGAGKGLLCDTVGIIVSGREFATTGFTPDDDEMRKRITAIAMEGDRMVLLDNISGNLAGSSLDRALTSTIWKDRLLGHTEQVEAPLWATWYGTGNNVQVEGDTARRICHIRIEVPDEHPEERSNFQHANLRAWMIENRPRLLGAALTILAAFMKAGKPTPDKSVKPWGSYEGWTAIVRNAIIWLGLPDPGETRTTMRNQSDAASSAMSLLIASWAQLDPAATGLTAAQVVAKLFPKHGDTPGNLVDVAASIEAILPRVSGSALGYKFRHFRRRTFEGLYLDHISTHANTVRWSVFPVKSESPSPIQKPDSPDKVEEVGMVGMVGMPTHSFSRNTTDKQITPLAPASPPSPPSPPSKDNSKHQSNGKKSKLEEFDT